MTVVLHGARIQISGRDLAVDVTECAVQEPENSPLQDEPPAQPERRLAELPEPPPLPAPEPPVLPEPEPVLHLACAAGWSPTQRNFCNFQLVRGQAVETIIGNEPFARRLLQRLPGANGIERIVSSWNKGVSARRAYDGQGPYDYSDHVHRDDFCFCVFHGRRDRPFILRSYREFMAEMRNNAGIRDEAILAASFQTTTEAAAFFTGAGCLWQK